MTVHQAISSGKVSADSIAATKRLLNENIRIGTCYMELVWNYKGNEFRTTAVIDQGVPTDPITSALKTGRTEIRKSIQYD